MLIVKPIQSTETLPPDSDSKFLDDACGIGTVTVEVKKLFPDAHILATDNAAGMLDIYNKKVEKHGYKNVTARLLDAGHLKGTTPQCFAFSPLLHISPPPISFLNANKPTFNLKKPRLMHPRCSIRQHHTRFCLHYR